MQEKTIIEMLTLVGFTELEATIYMALLRSKKGTAYEVGKSIKTRSNAYNVLKSLEDKNIITKAKKKNSTVYVAKKIENLVQEKQELENIVYKNILKLSASLQKSDKTSIKIWNTSNQIKEAIMYGLTNTINKKIYCLYPSSIKTTLSPTESVYVFTNKNINALGISKEIISEKNVRKEYSLVDNEYNFIRHKVENNILKELSIACIGIEIIKERMIKIYFYKEALVLCIENKNLANIALSLFEILKSK